jgi:polar amino acid transport system permease protein
VDRTVGGSEQGARATGLPAYSAEIPSGSRFLLIAAWLLLAEGGIGLVFAPVIVFSTPTDIGAGKILSFALCCLLCLGAGASLFSRFRWAWWSALAVAVAVPVWLLAIGGLKYGSEASVAAAFSGLQVVGLVLGRRAAGRPDAMALSSANIPFRLKVAIVWLAVFAMIATVLVLFELDTQFIRENFWFIAGGLQFTLLLAAGAIVLAVVLALFGALGRISRNPVAYGITGFYTSFFRGTPLIVQLFLIYLALPQIGGNLGRLSLVNILTLTSFQAGILGLGLNYGAYMTEIFRAGIQSVGHGQGEAADALGMSYWQRMRRVVLPQATRVIIPPTGNEFIAMMKDTALVGLLGAEAARAELFRRAQLAFTSNLTARLESLLVAAALYWALTAVFTFFQRKLERRVSRGYERGAITPGSTRPKILSLSSGGPGGPGGAHLPAVIDIDPAIVDVPPPDDRGAM